jgi:hypothetical protein
MNEIQEKLLIDIPELHEATNRISNLWNPKSSVAINADASMGKDEDMKYYCEEPWLMETIPHTSTSDAGNTAASSSGRKLGCVVCLNESLTHSWAFPTLTDY